MKIEIRKATIDNLDKLLLLKLESKEDERRLNKELLPVNKVKKNYKEYVVLDLKSKHRAIFIALADSEIIGMVIGRVYRSLKVAGYERRASVGNLYVKPGYRKEGIGKKLMKALIGWFKSKKVSGVTLGVYIENKYVIDMYKRMGFKVNVEMLYKTI